MFTADFYVNEHVLQKKNADDEYVPKNLTELMMAWYVWPDVFLCGLMCSSGSYCVPVGPFVFLWTLMFTANVYLNEHVLQKKCL